MLWESHCFYALLLIPEPCPAPARTLTRTDRHQLFCKSRWIWLPQVTHKTHRCQLAGEAGGMLGREHRPPHRLLGERPLGLLLERDSRGRLSHHTNGSWEIFFFFSAAAGSVFVITLFQRDRHRATPNKENGERMLLPLLTLPSPQIFTFP